MSQQRTSGIASLSGGETSASRDANLTDVQSVSFREMLPADLPEVLRVEKNCYDFPWSEKIFLDCLNAGYLCFVAHTGTRQLLGHGILMLGPGEAHVLNLCVQTSMRRKGVARMFLRHLTDVARQHQAKEVFLEVRESNVAAIKLYESAGFNRFSVRRGYYDSDVNSSGREDAMNYALTIC